ncbi:MULTISPECIES: DUF3558 family protein [unclassified Amycolatopsis]|uniref:DUF3558 domain-containing protein n=1 Tax=unclassified Amycolatopsis TaxID=2618356 RepID=UPI0028755704|nr:MULTISPECIES: DUF3558 family protein [unclassified Amycolatopsis]MDS0140569.1 DUF3558 family protein [Amycolatopsis sp. 505]MDS0149219.1 DUF3558 family protein [Amycolatopsis sp. CM201R]
MTDRHYPLLGAHCVPDMPTWSSGWSGPEPVTSGSTEPCDERFDVFTSAPEFRSWLPGAVDAGVPVNAVRFVVDAAVPASPVRCPRRAVTHVAVWLRTLGPDTPNRRLARIVRKSKARRRRQVRRWQARPRSMHRALRAAVAGIAATLAAVTACSSSSSPTGQSPVTAPASSTTGTPAVPFGGAPAIAHPLSETVLGGDPCADTLTSAQVRAILGAAAPGNRYALQGNPGCTWFSEDTGSFVGVDYEVSARTGLSGIYNRIKHDGSTWRAVPTIQGFPAVVYFSAGKGWRSLSAVSVGLSDQYAIDVSYGPGMGKDSNVGQVLFEIAAVIVYSLQHKAASR